MRTQDTLPLEDESRRLPGLTRCAHLLGAEASLTALLADVLQDEGVALVPAGAPADVVLALVGRAEALAPALQRAQGAPLIFLLPFADERVQRRALELGAHGCFALGEPLAGLRALVRGALRGDAGLDGGAPAPQASATDALHGGSAA
jgi:hypothetical protein